MQIANNNVDSFNNNIKGKEENEDGLYTSFIYSIRSEVTRQIYLRCLKYYMEFLGIKNLRELVEGKPQKIIEADIKAYLVYLRKQKKVSYNTKSLYLAAIRKFYYVNSDYQFKWNLITMYLGSDDDDTIQEDYYNNKHPIIKYDDDENEGEDDRPYTMDEIRKMFNAAQDIRVKIIISLLSSSGLRHGAVNILKLRDLEKIEKYNIYKITAYRKSKKYKYITFCTPECTSLVDSYLLYRKNQGEQLKDNSPLIREQFNTNDKLKINNSRHLTSNSIRIMINDVLTKYTNLRRKLSFDYENRRKEGKNPTMLTHGFRKFFNTECAKAGVYPDFIEMMLGHKLPGMRSHYMKPDINTLLEGTKEVKGYIAAFDGLTINEENRLIKQVQELKTKNEDSEYVIKGKLQEKEEQIKNLEESVKFLSDRFNAFLLSQPENNIVYDDDKKIKGITLNPEITHKAVGTVIPSSNSNNKKK